MEKLIVDKTSTYVQTAVFILICIFMWIIIYFQSGSLAILMLVIVVGYFPPFLFIRSRLIREPTIIYVTDHEFIFYFINRKLTINARDMKSVRLSRGAYLEYSGGYIFFFDVTENNKAFWTLIKIIKSVNCNFAINSSYIKALLEDYAE